jgi:hypothetical protein
MTYKLIQQHAQQADHWLIELDGLAPLAIGSHLHGPNWQACLFQQQGTRAHFLSRAPLPETPDWSDITLNAAPTIALSTDCPQLWLASGLAQAYVFDAAKRWQQQRAPKAVFCALLHTQHSFAFTPKPARFVWPLADEAIGASALLEDWGVVNRLAHPDGLPGCYEGDLVGLYQSWLAQTAADQAWQVCAFLPQTQLTALTRLSPNPITLHLQATD